MVVLIKTLYFFCFVFPVPFNLVIAAWGFGDPHFETLDGGNFTFNGWGEYTLLEAMDGFSLQGRTVAVDTSDNTSATQFSAFALGFSNASVQVSSSGGPWILDLIS